MGQVEFNKLRAAEDVGMEVVKIWVRLSSTSSGQLKMLVWRW